MRLRLAAGVAIGLGAEFGKVIAGRKAVAVALEQNHADSRILSARSSPSDIALYIALLSVLLVSTRQCQGHDAGVDLGFHMFSRSPCGFRSVAGHRTRPALFVSQIDP